MNGDRIVPVEQMLPGEATDPSATVVDNRQFFTAVPWRTSDPGRVCAM